MSEHSKYKGLFFSQNVISELQEHLQNWNSDRIFLLTDENTKKFCAPYFIESLGVNADNVFSITPGDDHKNIETLISIWQFLNHKNVDKGCLLINLGGGVVTDIGGFAASTYKRGMKFFNIPTTLLSMVDAAVGGKNGINFEGLKNQIGTIVSADKVFIDTLFLKTMDRENFLSGYAEIVKHGLITSYKDWNDAIDFDLENFTLDQLRPLLWRSIEIKAAVVDIDPTEKGIRKALNFGHTIGHAIESHAIEVGTPILHGFAVAAGMISELYLSHKHFGFPQDVLDKTIAFIRKNYKPCAFTPADYDNLYRMMGHDKKNENGFVNFTMLADVGDLKINNTYSKEEIFESLDFYLKIVS